MKINNQYLASDFILIQIECVTLRIDVLISGSITFVPGMGNMISLLISLKSLGKVSL